MKVRIVNSLYRHLNPLFGHKIADMNERLGLKHIEIGHVDRIAKYSTHTDVANYSLHR